MKPEYEFNAVKYIFEGTKVGFEKLTTIMEMRGKSDKGTPHNPLGQYGCSPESGEKDSFWVVWMEYILPEFGPKCENLPTLGLSNSAAANFACKFWLPDKEFTGADFGFKKGAIAQKKMSLWQENKAYSCGVIALYWTEVQEGKYQHSAATYAKFLIDSMRENRITNPDVKSSNGTPLFKRNNADASAKVDVFGDADLSKYKKFWMYAGDGGIFVSAMHWVAFYKRGNDFVMYDHNPNDSHRPPKEEFILNRANIEKFWERQGYKRSKDGGKLEQRKDAWMYIYGANN